MLHVILGRHEHDTTSLCEVVENECQDGVSIAFDQRVRVTHTQTLGPDFISALLDQSRRSVSTDEIGGNNRLKPSRPITHYSIVPWRRRLRV